MNRVYLTVGNIGSGKSTWASKFAKNHPDKVLIINRDSLRKMVAGAYTYSLKTEPVLRKMAGQMMETALLHGYDVVLDETNITAKTRKKWLRKLPNENVKVTYVVFDDHGENVSWRMNDDSRGYTSEYWGKVYGSMKSQYQAPSMDEFSEVGIVGEIINANNE